MPQAQATRWSPRDPRSTKQLYSDSNEIPTQTARWQMQGEDAMDTP
jgi:hypothetical protein